MIGGRMWEWPLPSAQRNGPRPAASFPSAGAGHDLRVVQHDRPEGTHSGTYPLTLAGPVVRSVPVDVGVRMRRTVFVSFRVADAVGIAFAMALLLHTGEGITE